MSFTAYEETSESLNITRDGCKAQITCYVAFEDAFDAAKDFIGGYQIVSGILVYLLPITYSRGDFLLYCNSVTVDPAGDHQTEEPGDWGSAKLTLTFGPLERKKGEPVELGDISYSVSAEELVLPKEKLHVGAVDGDPPDDGMPAPIKVCPVIDATITIKQKPELDPSVWDDLVGCVNSSTFRGWGTEKVMFAGAETKRTISSDGSDQWEHRYHFRIRPNAGGWNAIWDIENADWKTLWPRQYPTANLGAIFS